MKLKFPSTFLFRWNKDSPLETKTGHGQLIADEIYLDGEHITRKQLRAGVPVTLEPDPAHGRAVVVDDLATLQVGADWVQDNANQRAFEGEKILARLLSKGRDKVSKAKLGGYIETFLREDWKGYGSESEFFSENVLLVVSCEYPDWMDDALGRNYGEKFEEHGLSFKSYSSMVWFLSEERAGSEGVEAGREILTEDGYRFRVESDGTVTDGDQSWPSLKSFTDVISEEGIEWKWVNPK